jgi:hypothetical protein
MREERRIEAIDRQHPGNFVEEQKKSSQGQTT